ncbi:nucleotidyltransferase [Caulobacter flavus]|jgi:HEPN domain-containing protein/predicted nucleotidyltransferase|uniref:Nucleotidyltransferase n=1 Tax=Caulobacter flavus TaxID=1679497 RepID=A0A2N5CL17_9CAUL|nr:HEPN domain-containing protein [Caulobacter flavus]AYV48267.1 nucleotidyltransferase [Caulobacter flavus]PLR06427.1 nucleotidyltransferase [Caulobacter flavus]
MNKRLDHLPSAKRRQLKWVVDTVRDGFAEAIAQRTAPRLRDGKLLKIILFGSHARSDWVSDPIGRYFSDFDLLIVVDHADLTDFPEFWSKTDGILLDALIAGDFLRTPVSLIVHDIDDVNQQLELGRYFFMDIAREGIVLFEEPGHPFAEAKPLTPQLALEESQNYFEDWFNSANQFFDMYRIMLERGENNIAAFQLHQATERYYHALFLVLTLYSPKTHNLNQLRKLAEELDNTLVEIWPNDTKFHKRCYELLREAYVKARYSRHYRITAEELAWLGERVGMLRDRVRALGEARLAALRAEIV